MLLLVINALASWVTSPLRINANNIADYFFVVQLLTNVFTLQHDQYLQRSCALGPTCSP